MFIITIEQIQYFLAVRKYQGFSTAALELCISQSSLSKQIKALETELDTILFNRSSRNITLTAAGSDFYIYAEKFLKDYNNIIEVMKKHSISKNSSLKIGTIAVLTQYGLTSLIASFKNSHPDINLSIIEEENEAIFKMLMENEIDFAIMRDFNLPKDCLEITPIAYDELVVVTSNKHHFTKKKYITFDDLRNENFIICEKSGVYEICVKECSKAGFTPKVIHNISKIETILGLVSEGLGITLIVSNVLKPFSNPNIAVHHLKTAINSNLALVNHKDAPKYRECCEFKNFIIDSIKK